RFDFRRITATTILERLEYILKAKQVPYDEQGLKLIAQAAEGGMRDALSILDQALSLDNKRLTLDNAIQVTGTVDKKQLEAYFLAIIAANAAQALEDLHQLLASGRSPHRFIEAIIETCRDLLLIKTDDKLLDDFSRSLISPQIVAVHDQISQQQLYQMINAASQTQQDLHNVSRTDIYLEVLTVKLCEIMQSTNSEESTSSLSQTLQDLQSEVKQLKQNMADLQKKIAKAPQVAASPKTAPAKSFKSATGHTHVDQQKINQILANATRKALNQVREVWPDLMSMLNVTQKAVMKVSKPVAASSAGVVVAFDYAMWFERVMSNQELLEILKNNLDKLLNNDADVVIVAAENWPQIRQTFLQNHEITNSSAADVKKTKSTNVAVDKAQKLFGTELVELKKD
ncbi:MAG: DNA polymerase III subunit gamma/tau, partial [Bombilactobacillus sp.]|nr:DNA polymerase III subunit gamma/tau [Bombilactobacillus sp.]